MSCGTGWCRTSWTPTRAGTRRRTRRSGASGEPARSPASTAHRHAAAGDDAEQPTQSMSIEIANESGVAIDETSIVSVARFALSAMRIDPLAELSVMLVDSEAMAELHEQWLKLPGPTDVM